MKIVPDSIPEDAAPLCEGFVTTADWPTNLRGKNAHVTLKTGKTLTGLVLGRDQWNVTIGQSAPIAVIDIVGAVLV